ncbi:MAG: hypothetical protein ABH877_00140 [bacterium]
MAIHFTPWQFKNGDQFWAVSTPFSHAFVTRLKQEIPPKGRCWIAALKIWCVREAHLQHVRNLISEIYRGIPLCSCWYEDNPQCDERERLRELAFRAGGKAGCPVAPRRAASTPPERPAPPRATPPPTPPRSRQPVTEEPRSLEAARRVLGVPPGAPRATVRAAWKRLAVDAHPDVGGTHERMAAVNAARDLLLGDRRPTG